MKTKWIFVLVIFFSLLWLNPLKVSAAEIVSYDVDILMTTYYYNVDGTIYEGYPKKEIVAQYDSFSPMYVYYYQTSDGPHIGDDDLQYFVVSQYKFDERCVEIVKDSTSWYVYCWYSSTGYANPNKGYRELNITADNLYRLKQGYDNQGFYTAFINDTLDYNVAIDWDNPVYNETIGYLQNVMLKSTDFMERDFEITWSNNNGQYMNDDWYIQIGWNTRFQKVLFGEIYDWTNLELVTYTDNLHYSTGKFIGNFDDMYDEIPDCNFPSWWGSIYLRLVHVDKKTGLVEYGGWGQIMWQHKDDYGLTANYETIKYANSLDKNGVSESYDYQYEKDTESETSQSYVINTGSGTIDNITTPIVNGITDKNGNFDFSQTTDFFSDGLNSLYGSINQFPNLVSKVFSFLPSELITIISIGIVSIIILRFVGR